MIAQEDNSWIGYDRKLTAGIITTTGIWLLHVCLLQGSVSSCSFASGKRQLHVFLLQGSGSFMFASGKRQLHVCFREAAAV